MTRDERIKLLRRMCVRGEPNPDRFKIVCEPFAIGRWWSGATNGHAIVMVNRYLGLEPMPRSAYQITAREFLDKRMPRRATGYLEKRLRAWVRSTKLDDKGVGKPTQTPISIAGTVVDRRLVARALSAVPSSDGRVWLWKLGRSELDPLIIDGNGWRIVVMPLAGAEPRARWEKRSPGEERAA